MQMERRMREGFVKKAGVSASAALLMLMAVSACSQKSPAEQTVAGDNAPTTVSVASVTGAATEMAMATTASAAPAAQPAQVKPGEAVAIFAGGCFWCMEPPFDKLPGVISTTSGYTGGNVANPSYEQVSAGGTGHAESVQVRYDPGKVNYEKLLDVFWHNIDPFAVNRQFCDGGNQYRSGIFPTSAEQRRLAEASKQKFAARFAKPIATEITDATAFYPAEQYHQDYYKKNPLRYKFYRFNCGRDARLEQVWGKQG